MTTYLLIDGENIDATLGGSILARKPKPDERPRWDRVRRYVEDRWGGPVKALFFLAISGGEMPMPFVQALMAVGFTPVPLAWAPDQKVVDIGIQRTLDALVERPGDVVLASHDGDFVEQVAALSGTRRLGLLGFTEFRSARLAALEGVELVDLEYDVEAFTSRLPRLRVIPIDEFDPAQFL